MAVFQPDVTDEHITQIAHTPVPDFWTSEPPRLVVVSGTEAASYRVDRPLLLGRGREADIVLKSRGVSRMHARVMPQGNRYVVEDLGSRNGTLVNGISVERQELVLGDELRIGHEICLLFTKTSILEDRLVEQQKMEAIGRLSAGIAHEFNNVLAVIVASLEHLSTVQAAGFEREDVVECINDALSAANQATLVTQGLLGLARPAPGTPTSIHLGELLREVAQLARRTFPRSILIEVETSNAEVVLADRTPLFQSILNLCLNARDAMASGGTLRLQAKVVSPTTVALEVSDTGVGMTREQVRRIFEPFYTTKGHGKGTGLGLAVVYGAIKSLQGTVEVDSEPGLGTTFRITLPSAARPTEDRTPLHGASLPAARSQRTARVLLVDDEPLVLRSGERALGRAGFEVVTAGSGMDAVDAYRDAGGNIDVVVLDLNMPGVSGRETFDRLRRIDPLVRVVVLSGYAEGERENLEADGVCAVLTKPCETNRLCRAVTAALPPHRFQCYAGALQRSIRDA